jgi:hypothetical protein
MIQRPAASRRKWLRFPPPQRRKWAEREGIEPPVQIRISKPRQVLAESARSCPAERILAHLPEAISSGGPEAAL